MFVAWPRLTTSKGSMMKQIPKIPVLAKVDVKKVLLREKKSLGIDFANEIDIWAKMQFRAREQVKRLEKNETLDVHETLQELNTLIYAVRSKLD